MKLYAISDLHLNHAQNYQALKQLPAFPNDWLIVAGDVAERISLFEEAMALLASRFAQVFWTPGNHDLWTIPQQTLTDKKGQAKYLQMVQICQAYGIRTPEDPFLRWPGVGKSYVIAPTFTLYDYSFRPHTVAFEDALTWAKEKDILCTDEVVLFPDPYPSRSAWCEARCDYSERRLTAVSPQAPILLINHYPPRYDLLTLSRIPRFSLWCGTRRTESWLKQFNIQIGVYGHLHVRNTIREAACRFEEVSLGYPRSWNVHKGIASYFRQILPDPYTSDPQT